MRSSCSPEGLSVALCDRHAVAHVGSLLPIPCAAKLGIKELIDEPVQLGVAPRVASDCSRALTLVHSLLVGRNFIEDAAGLRTGATVDVLRGQLRAPSARGTFVRSLPRRERITDSCSGT